MSIRSLCRTAVFAVLVVLLAGCNKGDDKDKDAQAHAAVPVEVALAARGAISASYSGTATLDPIAEAQVVAKASGVILKLLVEEGMEVKQGQLLAQLDDDQARNSYAQADATLRKAQAKYDKSALAVQTGLIPKTQYDQDKYDLETQTEVVAGARLQLSYTRVVAPISGVIAKRDVKIGNLVQVNQSLFQIVDMNPLQAVLNVPERDLGMLKAQQRVHLRVDALPGKDFEGAIARIAPVVDAGSGTFRVTCEFADASAGLKPGMFGRIEVVYDQRPNVLVIPRSALIEEDGQVAVFVVQPGPVKPAEPAPTAKTGKGKPGVAVAATVSEPAMLAKRVVVAPGYAQGDRVEIRDGLAEGDRVITIGRSAVRDGTRVQVLEAVR